MEENKKKEKGSLIVIILLIIVILGLVGYICYDKGIIFKSEVKQVEDKNTQESDEGENNKQEEISNEKVDKSVNSVDNTASSKYCEGTYTYDDNMPIGDGELHKQVYTLKNDGTFIGSKNNTSKEEGIYIIKEDTIILIHHPETYGGPDNASYTSKSYYISPDCSYMSYEYHKTNGNSVRIKLTK